MSARKNKKMKEQLEKRKLELGVTKAIDNGQAMIFKEGSVDKDNEKFKKLSSKMMTPQIEYFDMDLEEERDRESMVSFMKKYAKLWKNLFYKYANSGFSSKQINNFD